MGVGRFTGRGVYISHLQSMASQDMVRIYIIEISRTSWTYLWTSVYYSVLFISLLRHASINPIVAQLPPHSYGPGET
ncbi:Uncharacterized protein HZ326_1273 [Fusarium oxysporum f. sp. albedinis]|nr:Uncharacterized protein HZ326_1273 [Fusarium oxysporum f. sp. albedinis]